MHAGPLSAAVAAVCPVISVKVGKAHDRATWSFIPTEAATQEQIDAAQNLLATIDDPPDPPRTRVV